MYESNEENQLTKLESIGPGDRGPLFFDIIHPLPKHLPVGFTLILKALGNHTCDYLTK
jgi:hypothetical protein